MVGRAVKTMKTKPSGYDSLRYGSLDNVEDAVRAIMLEAVEHRRGNRTFDEMRHEIELIVMRAVGGNK